MTAKFHGLSAGTLTLALLLSGCASHKPTNELVQARSAYDRARTSEAASLVPDRVLGAKQSLEAAEEAQDDDPGSFRAKSLAYMAQREADLAIAAAGMKHAEQRLNSYAQREQELQQKMRVDAQARLRQTRSELRDVRNELSSTGDKLSDKARELQEREQELMAQEKRLSESQTALAEEKKARQAAEQRAAAAIASLEQVAKVKEEQRGMVITLSGAVLFKTGESNLLPIAEQKLDKVAEALMEQSDEKKIVVEGHTDSVGSDANNMKLSQARADSVRQYLVGKGVPAERIRAVGRGESQPIAKNDNPEGRANNRRVEIVIGK